LRARGWKTTCEGRMKTTGKSDGERFQGGAARYANYLGTFEGRLRTDLAFSNLTDFFPLHGKESLRALDLGCGTGATAIRMARLGLHVTLLDSSEEMLEIAKSSASEAGVSEKLELKFGDAAELANLFPARSFNVILCHNILEYVDDPGIVLCAAARALRDSSAMLSVLVRNQIGEVLKAAIQGGDLGAAEKHLTAEWGTESLFGGKVRLFTPGSLRSLMEAAPLRVMAQRGVRVVADYLPPSVSRSAEYERILDLEQKMGSRPEFAAVARYTQCLARQRDPATEDRA